ncbi:MAG: NfeD family protein [Acidiferrobacterales bacterium]
MAGFSEKFRGWSQRSAIGADGHRWSARVVGKYTLLQLPATALLILILLLVKDRLHIPTWLVWSIVGFWVAKDVALFPFVWRSYDPGFRAASHSLVGAIGVTQSRLAPSGQIRVRSELWQAEAAPGARIRKGQQVRVREMRGLVLIVEPIDKASS